MRTIIAGLTFIFLTIACGTLAIVAKLFGVREGPGSVFDRAPRWWASGILRASGVRVVLHGGEQLVPGEPHIFASNHVSWYDVLALALVLPPYSFVAKAELFKVPLFGAGARAVGTIPIERDNRKAAFQSYEEAAVRIRAGRNVVVYPEGTRGESYPLRPFKKGPFVLAIAAGVPIIPTLIHGTIEANPRGTLDVTPGVVHVHLLEPVPTEGLTYDDRDALSRTVYERIADAQHAMYGIASPPYPTASVVAAPAAAAD